MNKSGYSDLNNALTFFDAIGKLFCIVLKMSGMSRRYSVFLIERRVVGWKPVRYRQNGNFASELSG